MARLPYMVNTGNHESDSKDSKYYSTVIITALFMSARTLIELTTKAMIREVNVTCPTPRGLQCQGNLLMSHGKIEGMDVSVTISIPNCC